VYRHDTDTFYLGSKSQNETTSWDYCNPYTLGWMLRWYGDRQDFILGMEIGKTHELNV